ncbi:MAG TPA: cytochrome P450 [Arenicellales bacterium]|nr:cytochrome P450 [Arenicellales bacterium]
MNDHLKADWEPLSADVQDDQESAYDEMREHCPVAYSDAMGWSVFRHDDVVRILRDHETFSSAVSRHRSVPNGMDPPEHTKYRRIVERYFQPGQMLDFEPVCRGIAAELVEEAAGSGEVELMADFALPFAARAQCRFLGWPRSACDALIDWYRRNQEAVRTGDRPVLARLAEEFERLIEAVLDERRGPGMNPGADVTASLMHEEVDGNRLGGQDITSILRNWTAGEIGTIAAATGILVHFLATHTDLPEKLRGDSGKLPAVIDEILRIHGPLVSNRRVAVRRTTIGSRTIEAGDRLSINWIAANRDPRAFRNPDELDPNRDPEGNLLYGAGIHVCPGAPLARLELRVAIEELLARVTHIQLRPDRSPCRASYPAAGFAVLPVRLCR